MTIRIYLSIVCVLLAISIGAGVYVWYIYQTMEQDKTTSLGGESTGMLPNEASERNEQKSNVNTVNTERKEGEPNEPIPPVTLTADMLSEKQRVVLEAFGMGDARVTVTETMILCIRNSMGDSRFDEILGGSAPTPFEALAIGVCIKKG